MYKIVKVTLPVLRHSAFHFQVSRPLIRNDNSTRTNSFFNYLKKSASFPIINTFSNSLTSFSSLNASKVPKFYNSPCFQMLPTRSVFLFSESLFYAFVSPSMFHLFLLFLGSSYFVFKSGTLLPTEVKPVYHCILTYFKFFNNIFVSKIFYPHVDQC